MLSDWPTITQELDSIAFSLDPESTFLQLPRGHEQPLGNPGWPEFGIQAMGGPQSFSEGGGGSSLCPAPPRALSRVQDPHPSSQAPGAEQEALGPAGWPQDGSKKEGGNRKDCTRNAKQAFK